MYLRTIKISYSDLKGIGNGKKNRILGTTYVFTKI